MRESFVKKNTASPTTKSSVDCSHKSPHKHHSSQSPSIKSKKSKDNHGSKPSIVSKHAECSNSSTSSHVNGKNVIVKDVSNAMATTPVSQNSPKKSSTKQPGESLQTLTGTPIKHKLVDRTNGNDVIKPFYHVKLDQR